MTSGAAAAAAPPGEPGPAGMKHRAGGPWRGQGQPETGAWPLFPCRSPGCPVQIAPAALESLAPAEGSQDRNAFTRLSFIHETIKFFLFFLLKTKKKGFFF